jgi:sarcosine oxidase
LPIEGFDGPIGLKIAYHAPGEVIEPGQVKSFDGSQVSERLLAVRRRYFWDQKMTMLNINSCMYTYSSDDDFIIDYLPQTDEKIILATGFSGHGFKFVPAIGDVLSKMAR